jgi:hypothetical protein
LLSTPASARLVSQVSAARVQRLMHLILTQSDMQLLYTDKYVFNALLILHCQSLGDRSPYSLEVPTCTCI